MKILSQKEFAINKTWGCRCTTHADFYGRKKYLVEIVMLTVPWLEVVDFYEGYDKDASNNAYKELVAKYKKLG